MVRRIVSIKEMCGLEICDREKKEKKNWDGFIKKCMIGGLEF